VPSPASTPQSLLLAVLPLTYDLNIPISYQVKCFCTAHSFQLSIAPCIAAACGSADQTQTETYANGICQVVGIKLPSFRDLLAEAATTSGSEIAGVTVTPIPYTNSTSNSTGNTTVTFASTESAATTAPTLVTKSEGRRIGKWDFISATLALFVASGLLFLF
jgi:CFEM domain